MNRRTTLAAAGSVLILLLTGLLVVGSPAQGTELGASSAGVAAAAPAAGATAAKPKKDRYVPKRGPMFNDPFGKLPRKNKLANHLKEAIAHAKKHSVIRIAVYSFNRQDLYNSLVSACRRKVAVQIVVNDNIITPQIRNMRRYLGTKIRPKFDDACHPRNPKKQKRAYKNPSFLVVCSWSCRYKNGIGNQHIKAYLFSRTGAAKHVVMFGSNNMATYAAYIHWNDLYTVVDNKQMYLDWSEIFRQLSKDKRVKQPFESFIEGPYVTEFAPKDGARRKKDPVAQRLANIDCKAPPGYGTKGHTEIRVTMYAWVHSRGIYLAQQMAKLARKGCRVKTILSSPGAYVVGTLRAAGVQMRSADLNLDHDDETGFDETPWEKFTHEKWMSVDGVYAGQPVKWVWTGSENWANKSYFNDEVTVQIPYARTWRKYNKHFNYVWSKHTRPVGRRYARELAAFWERRREMQAAGLEVSPLQ